MNRDDLLRRSMYHPSPRSVNRNNFDKHSLPVVEFGAVRCGVGGERKRDSEEGYRATEQILIERGTAEVGEDQEVVCEVTDQLNGWEVVGIAANEGSSESSDESL